MCKYRQPNSWKRIYWLCNKYGKRCPGTSWFRCPERLPVTLAVIVVVLMAAAMAWG